MIHLHDLYSLGQAGDVYQKMGRESTVQWSTLVKSLHFYRPACSFHIYQNVASIYISQKTREEGLKKKKN